MGAGGLVVVAVDREANLSQAPPTSPELLLSVGRRPSLGSLVGGHARGEGIALPPCPVPCPCPVLPALSRISCRDKPGPLQLLLCANGVPLGLHLSVVCESNPPSMQATSCLYLRGFGFLKIGSRGCLNLGFVKMWIS